MNTGSNKIVNYFWGFIAINLFIRFFVITFPSVLITWTGFILFFISFLNLLISSCKFSFSRDNLVLGLPYVTFSLAGLWFFLLLMPLGLFGFTGILKTSFGLNGTEFTFLTINRIKILIILAVIYILILLCSLRFRSIFQILIERPNLSLSTLFSEAKKQTSFKDSLDNFFRLIAMLVTTWIYIGLIAGINYLFVNQILVIISQVLIDIGVLAFQTLIVFDVVGINFAEIKPRRNLYPVLGLMLISAFFSGLTFTKYNFYDQPQTIIAHRGVVNNDGPANNMQSLNKTSSLHFPYSEMDVQETRDHHFIVQHDDNIIISGKSYLVNDLTLKDVQRAKKVELFNSYLRDAKRNGQKIIVELKVTNHSDPNMGTRFAKQFKSQLISGQDMVHSVGYPYLRQVKKIIPQIKVGLVTMLNFSDLRGYQVDFYSIQHITLNNFLISQLKETGRPIYSWTDDNPLGMRRLILMGVNGQITDRADLLRGLNQNTPQNYSLLLLNSLMNYS